MFSYHSGDLPKSKVRAFEFIKVLALPVSQFARSAPGLFVCLAAVRGFRAGFVLFGKRRDLWPQSFWRLLWDSARAKTWIRDRAGP